MKTINIILFIILTCQLCAQETSDIIVDTELNNPTNNTVVRIVKSGEVLSNNAESYEYQMLAVYDVIPNKYVLKVANQWLITVPPKQTISIQLKCRCLNKGLKIPPAKALIPTGYGFNKGKDLENQAKTWASVNRSKGVLAYAVKGKGRSSDCLDAVKLSVNNLFRTHNISVDLPQLDPHFVNQLRCAGISENLELDMSVVPVKIPVRLINMKAETQFSNGFYDALITADIYIEPKYHQLFGK